MDAVFKTKTELVVVGAGVAGLACALALAKARPDKKVMIIGALAGADQIVTLTPGSFAFLESLGLSLRGQANPVYEMRVFSGSELRFDAADSGLPSLAWVVRQSDIQAQLEALVARQGIQRIEKAVEGLSMSGDRSCMLSGEGFDVTCSLVVAADGAQSRVRALSGITCETHVYPQRAVVAELSFDGATPLPEPHTAYQWFGPHGVLALLPMGLHRYCMVWSAPEWQGADFTAHQLADGPETDFLASLGKVIDRQLGQPRLLGARRAFPLSRIRPEKITGPRLALVGDAAHQMHPLAGQGLNLGLGDVESLAGVLGKLPSPADPGEAIVLRRYARARAEPIALMLGLTHALQRAFLTASAPDIGERLWRVVRELGWRSVNRVEPLKQALIRRASA